MSKCLRPNLNGGLGWLWDWVTDLFQPSGAFLFLLPVHLLKIIIFVSFLLLNYSVANDKMFMKCLVFVITYNKALIESIVFWWIYIDYKGENPLLMVFSSLICYIITTTESNWFYQIHWGSELHPGSYYLQTIFFL